MAIDLFGQVAAACMGTDQHSATGGQVDFVRGAQLSKGGKSFIALTSTRKGGSRIVSGFPLGTPTTTGRADVQYVVTEYGCTDLSRLTNKGRVHALVELAHPDYRPELIKEAKARRRW